MNPLYSLKNIRLKYPFALPQSENQFVLALDNLSLDIYENECLAIMGGNGSGKSSLAKLLAGLAGDFSGELHYRG
ncbi:MAG: ATP-binding cassette domain-containing protein, partial [candidate division Zixibacteria bacterium]|nr:ATP-binding cassette domain-containing protein [candidate division Zixibacteria bacterium]